ncbi:ABC transporter substrate-binding protein [Natrialbaceae archaeon A-CW1-1]
MTYDTSDKTRRTVLKTVGAAGVVGVAGCLGGDDSSESDNGDGNGGDDQEDRDRSDQNRVPHATIAINDDPTRDDWNHYGGVTPYWTNILEPLVWVSNEMELVPWLATEWEQTGERTWEFSLREGVQFHNGEEVTADEVVFSFENILDEYVWAPGWLHLESGNIEALDTHLVEFTTTDPFPTFPGTIAHNMVAIQHPDRDHTEDRVIGTGPFQVEEIEQHQEVRTSAFEDYWNDEPILEELTFRVIEDPNTRTLSLENREIDVALAPPRSRIASIESDDSLYLDRQSRPGAGYVGINIHKSPTDDVALRQALNHAISQETIVDTILEGVGDPGRGPISPIIYWSAHDEITDYEKDDDLGAELVSESGYDGEPLEILVANDLVDGREMAQVIQGSLDGIGVNSDIQVLERAAYSEAERDGEAHLILKESGSNSGDADYIIYEGFHSEGDVNQRLYEEEGTGLHNLGGEVDDLIEQGFQTGDEDEKAAAYKEAQQHIADEAVTIPLYYSEFIAAAHENIDGANLGAVPQFSRWTDLEHWE